MSLEQDILSLERKFWQLLVERDVPAAAELVTDPCIVTGAQGVGKIDRKTFVQVMESGDWTLDGFELSDVQFEQVADDVAVIAYRVREDMTVDGERITLEAADASTWVRRDGKWLCVLHAESHRGDPFGRDRKPAGG